MFDIITIFLVGTLLLIAVYTAIQFRGKFPKRTIEDVTPFLRPAEHDELESLLDPAQETNFRHTHVAAGVCGLAAQANPLAARVFAAHVAQRPGAD